MSKREARSIAAAGVDVDAPRAKRRKEAPAASSTSPNGKQTADAANAAHAQGHGKSNAENAGVGGEDRDAVREKGMELWQTVKDAVNKEGQIASFQFMRLPSKRQYPDYYVQIKRPIALDDIKSKLEAREYASLAEVRQDLETCFRNAKRYNMKESQIFKDAKFLHKLVTKEYSRITGTREEPPADDGDEKAASDDEGGAKKKTPNLHRLLKTRLQKLVDKTDDTGRILSTQFMELPSRKQWPMYYQIIKKPQALENIFKKLKRKEYSNPTDFANDVELVFSNALEFNLEHTQIWEDAVALREYFRKLMADLPEPYSIPAYVNAGDHPTKIKLKMPSAPTQPIAAPAPTLPSSNAINVPRSHAVSSSSTPAASKSQTAAAKTAPPPRPPTAVKSPAVTPALPPTPVPIQPAAPAASSQAVRPQPIAPSSSTPTAASQSSKSAHTGTLQPALSSKATAPTTYYPNAVYQQPIAPALAPKATATSPPVPQTHTVATPAPPTVAALSRPSPPAATLHAHPLKHAIITTMHHHRRLVLHHEDGVRTWTMRLTDKETGIILSNVALLSRGDNDEDSSADEEHDDKDAGEDAPASPTKGKKRGRPPRKRGKAPAAEASKKAKGKAAETVPGAGGGIQVKLNGVVCAANEGGDWEIRLPTGISVLELGEKGGMVWKVYLDRAAS